MPMFRVTTSRLVEHEIVLEARDATKAKETAMGLQYTEWVLTHDGQSCDVEEVKDC